MVGDHRRQRLQCPAAMMLESLLQDMEATRILVVLSLPASQTSTRKAATPHDESSGVLHTARAVTTGQLRQHDGHGGKCRARPSAGLQALRRRVLLPGKRGPCGSVRGRTRRCHRGSRRLQELATTFPDNGSERRQGKRPRRPTRVVVYCVPMDDSALASSGSSMAAAASAVPGHELATRHFAAGFFYAGSVDLVDVCEAGRDAASGDLVAYRSWRRDTQMMAGNAVKVVAGQYPITRRNVNAAMDQMKDLGSYNLLSNNCQDFVRKLLAKLKIKFPSELVTARILAAEIAVSVAAQTTGAKFLK
ncbi:uncharacterized protein [Dermacentor albipictus]|uniref:uncharacterized protein isoform X4 n=1 Tax=Dermacentor albipictus TaxID=60249 RepID=UPI0038FCB38D